VSGNKAKATLNKLFKGVTKIKIGESFQAKNTTILRLTENEYFILSDPEEEAGLLSRLEKTGLNCICRTGAMACFLLAGPGRFAVLERSSACNLEADEFLAEQVLQTTVHGIPVIIYRQKDMEVLLCYRDTAEFLFEALPDVGDGVVLVPAGLDTLTLKPGDSL